jgi:holo-[acyl-carrier protein] synthase
VIIGIGSDLSDIRRIEKTLERFGERFIKRTFTTIERDRSERKVNAQGGRAASYAKRFAAKEACAKALGTGFRRGVYWRDLEVVNLPSGQPTMRLSGAAAAHLARLVPPGWEPVIHVSLTDDPPMAQAIVIISAIAPGTARA